MPDHCPRELHCLIDFAKALLSLTTYAWPLLSGIASSLDHLFMSFAQALLGLTACAWPMPLGTAWSLDQLVMSFVKARFKPSQPVPGYTVCSGHFIVLGSTVHELC